MDPSEYLPARMINELVYCPRLFYYEHVLGVFVHNLDTIEGSQVHRRVDAETPGELPPAETLLECDRPVRSRSVTLSSDRYGVIAKMDLLEVDGSGCVTPVDYKRGSPRQGADGQLEAWPSDRVQVGVQALILRENGYRCEQAVIYYASTRQRVRIPIDESLIADTLAAIAEARQVASSPQIPPPLEDSPKCPRCSLVGICLPDETQRLSRLEMPNGELVQLTLFDTGPERQVLDHMPERNEQVRRLIPARDDLRPLYLHTQGIRVSKTGRVLNIEGHDYPRQEVRLHEVSHVSLYGNIQITTQAIQALCEEEIPVAFFSMGGWFYGMIQNMGIRSAYLRREQFRLADSPSFCLQFARALVAGKIRNQRTMLLRNHVEPPETVLVQMKCLEQDARRAQSLDQLLGIEGNGARLYFESFAGMIKVGRQDPWEAAVGGDACGWQSNDAPLHFDFQSRNRRPPRDPVNALLSLAYSLLVKDLTLVVAAVGLDPYWGFYHQPRSGRPALALDLMEPFRPLIADSAVLTAINSRMVRPGHFIRTADAVALTRDGRKQFFHAYEQRMDSLVTHPLFSYRVNYRRVLEIQTRLLARMLSGELWQYPVFTTR